MDEDKKEEKKVEMTDEEKQSKLVKSIAEQLIGAMKTDKEQAAKQEAINSVSAKTTSKMVTVAKTRKGKEIKATEEEAELGGKWLKAFFNSRNDSYAFHKINQEMMTKLQPLNETTAASGGILLPTIVSSTLIPLLEDIAVIRPRARVMNISGMGTNTFTIPTIGSKPVVTWGGVEQTGADKGTSSVSFGSITLTPYTLSTIVPMSNQLVQDSPISVLGLVTQLIAESLAKAEDKAFTVGTGSSQPSGIDSYTLSGVDMLNSLTYAKLLALFWKLPQAYRATAVWIMNSRTMSAIQSLTDTTGRPLISHENAFSVDGLPSLFGHAVLEQNDLASSKILFGDLNNYWIADNGGVSTMIADQASIGSGANSINLFSRNMIGVRVERRTDAELGTTRAFVKGTNTGVA